MAVSIGGHRSQAAAGVANSLDRTLLTADSRFQLGCITKLLTSVMALELFSAGRLDLDRAIQHYLPDLVDMSGANPITPRHLLSHTSGYQGVNVADPRVRYGYDWKKFAHLLRSGTRLFAPGTVFNYEHTECVLLGAVIEHVTGQPLHELLQRHIWQPLGLQWGNLRTDAARPALRVAEHSFDVASGEFVPLRTPPYCAFWDASLSDLTMSVSDLVTLGEAIAGVRAPPLFSDTTIQMVRTTQIALPWMVGQRLHEQMPLAFGHGCGQYGASVFGHNGSTRGQTCALRFDVASGLVLAVALNCWRPHVRDMLCAKVIATQSRNLLAAQSQRHLDWHFAELGGRYLGAVGVSAEVCLQNGNLICRLNSAFPQSSVRVTLSPGPEGTLEVRSEATHLTIGFFTVPGSRERALMIGLNAYRRESTGN